MLIISFLIWCFAFVLKKNKNLIYCKDRFGLLKYLSFDEGELYVCTIILKNKNYDKQSIERFKRQAE